MSSEGKTVSVTINYQAFEDSKLYRLKKSTILHVVPGESLLGKRISIQTNYPSKGNDFVRTKFVGLEWFSRYGEKVSNDDNFAEIRDLEMYCHVTMLHSGTFKFNILEEDKKSDGPCGSIYCQVEPDIYIGRDRQILKLESIRCQTVLSKCLGPLKTWEEKLRVAKESGYNLIHFTPVQELAGSRSAYSLADQLKIDPGFGNVTYEDVGKVVNKLRDEWGMASICDIVLNHTGNESLWLLDHPEATYSCNTCPHLRPAFMLDILLAKIGEDVNKGNLEMDGCPSVVDCEDHIQALRHQLVTKYLPMINIHEFYQIDVELFFTKFVDAIRSQPPPSQQTKEVSPSDLKFVLKDDYRRKGVTIDLDVALTIFNVFRNDCFDEDNRIRKCGEGFRKTLEDYNARMKCEIDGHMKCAVGNALAGVRYERVQHDGPQFRTIDFGHPLFVPYFTHTGCKDKSLEVIETMMYEDAGKFFMGHNGWIMGGDPLNDFGRPQSGTGNVYLRRELIAWGDSVKLRFGDKPEDNPYLWARMKEYVDTTAKYFSGVRLDNCHSTPLHVAEYLIDSARKVNPELYVVAELFTNSPDADNIFVNRLGITSLIREALSAWDSHEEGRLVYLYGGEPVGAFFNNPNRPLAPNIAHAIFFDQTHDNQSYIEKRSVFDLVPSAALVSMACCATGSNRGFDELVPHHIHVVNEERQYQEWEKQVSEKSGIIAAKRALNDLHGFLGTKGFNQVFVDQMNPDIVGVTRQNPITNESFILIAHTAFGYPHANSGATHVRPLIFEGKLEEIYLECEIRSRKIEPFARPEDFKKNPTFINGLDEYDVTISKNIQLNDSRIFDKTPKISGNSTQLDLVNLKPGSVVVVRVSPHDEVSIKLKKLNELIINLQSENGTKFKEIQSIISNLSLVDLNLALFSCDQEERDRGFGFEAYDIPGFKRLEYAGFQGVLSLLSHISPSNDLGHPLCGNLRSGNWLIDYISDRLNQTDSTKKLSEWLKENLEAMKGIPRYLIPAYFDAIITGVYGLLIQRVLSQMPNYISKGSIFPQLLAISSLQFLAPVKSAPLPDLSPNVSNPKPPKLCTTLAAGLEHFVTGYMRCWGRDTFISLRGLMLITGRYDEARYIILAFAGTLRHGLIPNLLDGGKSARYNCRDAVWWWLYCIQEYITEAPNGKEILKEKVSRLYPQDDSPAMPADGANDQLLHDVMQEALNVHFQGLVFRERNAGKRIDEHMTDVGFNNQIGINPETGFVFGGNDANCGTWMDKMGSSEKAKTKGIPSSPRDGAAVELVGLQASVLRFLEKSSDYPYKSVERKNPNSDVKIVWTFKEWAERIEKNFEKFFYVSENDTNPLVHKRTIYKDTHGASRNFADFQLRCNFPIAMVVAPQLFDPNHAWEALEVVRKYLLGPLGMKTLDPDDWSYRPNYDNSNDSEDGKVAHGYNYHQGPEWLWPIGYYLRARLIFGKKLGKLKEVEAETWKILTAHLKELRTSPWRGLPELTNDHGSFCHDSCRTQAWSVATVLEILYDLEQRK
ncbi:CLUMA_CG007658, isoform A [Clunio marinus]|nr:CLUMA_CG007658, isoform A [Clunio marinus]